MPKQKIKPEHKAVLAELVKNGGNISRAVREAKDPKTGKKLYSDRYAHSEKITKTKSWSELLKRGLPDDKLLNKHNELLEAENENVQLGALRLGYEIKGRTKDPQAEKTVFMPLQVNFIVNGKPEHRTIPEAERGNPDTQG